MNVQIIGVGRVGAEMAYTFMLLRRNMTVFLYEPNVMTQELAHAQYLDLLPVANATGNVVFESKHVPADLYVLCAGVPRTDPCRPKSELFDANLKIALDAVKHVPTVKPLFVVSNPPVMLAEALREHGYAAIPLRKCTDNLRGKVGDPDLMNMSVLRMKGYTQFTPAYACVSEILRRTETK